MGKMIEISSEEYAKFLEYQEEQKKSSSEVSMKVLLDKIDEQQKSITELKETMMSFSQHLSALYASQDIETSLKIMGNLGEKSLDCENCEVYSVDVAKNQLFTVDESGEREYLAEANASKIYEVFKGGEVYINNDFNERSSNFGVGLPEDLKNIAVIPLESKNGDNLGVVVVKNKMDGEFTKDDVAKFSLENGQIGASFRQDLEKKRAEQESVTDALTHLKNRKGLPSYSKSSIIPTLDNDKPISVAICDIDKFKSVNDTYGHKTGDEVLQHVSKILSENIRSSDTVIRWGGEEFVMIFNGLSAEQAYEKANKLRELIENTPCSINDGKDKLSITLSMGVQEINKDKPVTRENISAVVEETISIADIHLYAAKEGGRNRVVADKEVMAKIENNHKKSIDDLLQMSYGADNKQEVKR